MEQIGRRRFVVMSLGLAGAVMLPNCSSDDSGTNGSSGANGANGNGAAPPVGGDVEAANAALAEPGSPGLVDEAAYQARIDRYLDGATEEFDPSNPVAIAAQLIAAHRDPDYRWDPSEVTVEGLDEVWERIDTWQDTRDFRFMYLHWILALADGSSEMTTLDPEVIEAIEQRMIDNRWQWNDPLPEGRIDNLWFWSENHLIIGYVSEYLAGQRLPDETFTITGLTGAEHAARAKAGIIEWVDHRARFGFSEWHSQVYMQKDVEPLLTLIELAEDPELVVTGAMGMDLCLLDMAGHNHNGSYTASRGRTYANTKTSPRESTFDMFKLLFDDTPFDHTEGVSGGATFLAGCTRYRPPQVLIEMGTADDPGVVLERHGIWVDGTEPVTDNPEAPFGYDFDDPDNLAFWWAHGALGLWQLTDVNLAAAEEFRLFETELMSDIAALVAINEGDPDRIREWLRANHSIVNFGHLREANSYGWRGDEVSLATVVDHRFGEMRDQIHTWQAAVDPEALVFTTHPANDLPESEDLRGDGRPGYWTGEASIPRSAQHERTGIHIYQPAWDETTDELLWSVFGYEDFTHAYVPQDRFDETVRDGNWTFVRKGDGYIALWSWRTPEFREYDPAVHPMLDMEEPYDLVAEGGPDNVWIVEVGDPSVAGSFEEWMAAVTASEPQVERDDDGFTVAWESPTSGEVTFGSTAAFTVDGAEQPIGDFPRHESQWGTVESLDTTFELESDDATLELDFATGTRTVGVP
ncbi:MAG: hypothetical protein JJU45_05075 [Acidimicrobiia bacterium]|nr:hypothetical protein [Acidimicrobiia bacterium]